MDENVLKNCTKLRHYKSINISFLDSAGPGEVIILGVKLPMFLLPTALAILSPITPKFNTI